MALRSAEALAAGDDNTLCLQYKLVAGDLEASLLSSLAEEECIPDLLDVPPTANIGVSLPTYPLLTAIRNHGAVGPAPVPTNLRVTLAAHSLSQEEGMLPEDVLVATAGRVIVSWSQPRCRNSGDTVRFRIQRGVCDNLPGPCPYAPTAAMGRLLPSCAAWGVEEELACSVGPSSTPMGGAVERNVDGNTQLDRGGGTLSTKRTEREIGRLLLFETIGDVEVQRHKGRACEVNLMGCSGQGVGEDDESDDNGLLGVHGRECVLLTMDGENVTPPEVQRLQEVSRNDADEERLRLVQTDGRLVNIHDNDGTMYPTLRCVSTPVSAPDLLQPSDSTSMCPPRPPRISLSIDQAEGEAREGEEDVSMNFAFVSDVSHFAAHVVHFRVQSIDGTGTTGYFVPLSLFHYVM